MKCRLDRPSVAGDQPGSQRQECCSKAERKRKTFHRWPSPWFTSTFVVGRWTRLCGSAKWRPQDRVRPGNRGELLGPATASSAYLQVMVLWNIGNDRAIVNNGPPLEARGAQRACPPPAPGGTAWQRGQLARHSWRPWSRYTLLAPSLYAPGAVICSDAVR